jgi:hypothetical protein
MPVAFEFRFQEPGVSSEEGRKMGGIFSYKCASCSRVHEGSPSYGFAEPWHYTTLSKEQRLDIAKLSSDACIIKDTDHFDFFIRVCLEVPIIGMDEPFLWGVWISLSENNFRRYNETWDNPVDEYFGFLCTKLPLYPDTIGLKTLAHPRSNGQRPTITLEPTDHPLSVDFREGLTIKRAQEIAEQLMHPPPTA